MTTPRKNAPRHQHIASSTYSDLEPESDYGQAGYLSSSPPPSTRTDTELNLSVLRRHNPQLLALHHVAPYAVVYTFSSTSSAWEKCGIEGSAFLVSLLPTATHASRFAVMVLNRRGLENFSLELQSSEEVEVADEYIILQGERGGEPCVFGLWVFAEPAPASTSMQRVEMARKIMECAEKVEAGRRMPPGPLAAADDEGYEGEAEDGALQQGASMGRQGSLTAMLEQQRQADDSWSVRSHSPLPHMHVPSPNSAPALGIPTVTKFAHSADTDFFLAARPPLSATSLSSPAVSASQESTKGPGVGQRDTLLELFRKAGEGYRGNA